MRLVPIQLCAAGMRLGRSILSDQGHVLLGSGFELTASVIRRLAQLGIHQLYINDPRTEDIVVEETLREETRRFVHNSLLQCADYIHEGGFSAKGRIITLSRLIGEAADRLVEDVVYDRNGPVVHIRQTVAIAESAKRQFCDNALNVAVLTTKLLLAEGASRDNLLLMCTAALFHDIGKLLVPAQLLTKRSALTEEELRAVRLHTELGHKAIKEDGSLSLIAAQCALQHHERMDGLGYPFGLKGDDIHPYAKLIGMTDAYDALVSPRSYRSAMLPHEAMDYLYANVESAYDHSKVEQFRNKVAIFPPGTAVTLNTGERGVVSRLDASCLQRPTVRVLTNPRGEDLKSPYDLQLSKHLSIMIRSVGELQSHAG